MYFPYFFDLYMPHTKPPGSHTAVLSIFPAKSRAMLQLVEINRSTEVGQILVDFAASTIHPDFVCNIGVLASMSNEVKRAVLEFFEHTLSPGFTIDEAGAIFAWLTPHLQGMAGPPFPK